MLNQCSTRPQDAITVIGEPYLKLDIIVPLKGSSKARTETGSPHHKNRRRMSAESTLLMSPSQSVAGCQEINGKNIKAEGETASVVIDIDCQVIKCKIAYLKLLSMADFCAITKYHLLDDCLINPFKIHISMSESIVKYV